MTVGVEQASDEDCVAVQGLGDDSNGTYRNHIEDKRIAMGRPRLKIGKPSKAILKTN